MIVIDGTEIKKKYLDICTEIEQSLQNNINTYILQRSADIQKDINKMLDDLKGKASNTDKLVELEQKKELIKNKENKRIVEEFNDLKKWLYMIIDTHYAFEEKSY